LWILSLPSQDPVYRRAYAAFKRSLQAKRTPTEVKDAFAGNLSPLFESWLKEGRSFEGATLRLKQSRELANGMEEQCAYRTFAGVKVR
jgi:hypothetical protein